MVYANVKTEIILRDSINRLVFIMKWEVLTLTNELEFMYYLREFLPSIGFSS
jgi:hypothetical protein